MDGIADTTMRAIEFAMRGTAKREEIHAHNIANSSVPNYRAKSVSFEDQLSRALDSNGAERVEGVRVNDADGIPNAQGNTVKLEGEMVGLMKNNMVQDAMVQSYNFKAQMFRTAIGKG